MKKVRRRGRRRQRKQQISVHKKSILAVSFVILLLVVVLSIDGVSLRAKDKAYQAQEAELKQQIEEEKERSLEIDKLEQYVGTDEYVEEVAKDKLGLVNKGEIIFKAK